MTEVIARKAENVAEDKSPDDEAKCPNCGSTRFSRDGAQGELYCRECGIIIEEDSIDFSSEKRTFDQQDREKKERSGSSLTYTRADRGMGTKMGSYGEMKNVSGKRRGKYYRMKKWDQRTSDSKQRGLNETLSLLQRLISDLNLPESVFEESARLAEKAVEEDVVKGRRKEAVIGALAFLVARKQEVPRTLDEIAEAASVDEKQLGKTYRYVMKELDMDVPPPRPENFLPRFATELGLSGETTSKARNIIKEAREKGILAGRGPKGIVASTIYIVSIIDGEDLNQREIANTVGVTEVTIRKNYRNIAEELGLEEEIEKARN